MLSYSKDDLFLWSHFDIDMFCWLTLCFYSILLPFLDGYQKGGLDKKQKNVLGVTPQDDQLISKLFCAGRSSEPIKLKKDLYFDTIRVKV